MFPQRDVASKLPCWSTHAHPMHTQVSQWTLQRCILPMFTTFCICVTNSVTYHNIALPSAEQDLQVLFDVYTLLNKPTSAL